jgi:hypothetical protein
MNIKLLERNCVVAQQLHWALLQNEWLWNRQPARTVQGSPHEEMDDIWVRFGTLEDGQTDRPHEAQWYEAIDAIPLLKTVCEDIAKAAGASTIGGVLITRLPPGATCLPHVDDGWHAKHYEKYALQITSAPGQKFCFHDEELETRPGDLFWFANQSIHWVINPTKYERITLIVCVSKE